MPTPISIPVPNSTSVITIPLEFRISLVIPDGSSGSVTSAPLPQSPPVVPTPTIVTNTGAASLSAALVPAFTEAISIDPNYSNRKGYSPDFLGTGMRLVPLPKLSTAIKAKAAINQSATGAENFVLPYHHFSVVMNAKRRLAFFTAVNIDGKKSKNLQRETDKWIFDPRLKREEQVGEEIYAQNPLDRGHLVRRLDPAWGASDKIAKTANDDTFHFTNCTPQHHAFNAGHTLWAGLEDYLLKNAQFEDLKASVFTGPVLDDANDPEYRGIQLPRQFWKVAVMLKSDGKLSATAYLLSQDDLIDGLEEAFVFGAYRTFQVTIEKIETLTGLDFGVLKTTQPPQVNESLTNEGLRALELESFADIVV